MRHIFKFIVTGYKRRHCGRLFYYSKDKRWNLMFGRDCVRDIRKDKKYAKETLPKEYWRYL